jgi:hypothetical protein
LWKELKLKASTVSSFSSCSLLLLLALFRPCRLVAEVTTAACWNELLLAAELLTLGC